MGGPTPSTRSLSQAVSPPRGTKRDPATMHSRGLMRPVRPMETYETCGDLGGKHNGYPFTTFGIFPTFLGELDSRYQSFINL